MNQNALGVIVDRVIIASPSPSRPWPLTSKCGSVDDKCTVKTCNELLS